MKDVLCVCLCMCVCVCIAQPVLAHAAPDMTYLFISINGCTGGEPGPGGALWGRKRPRGLGRLGVHLLVFAAGGGRHARGA